VAAGATFLKELLTLVCVLRRLTDLWKDYEREQQ
jgi:hypothetical protein